MEEKYKNLYKALDDLNKEINRLLRRKKDEEKLMPIIDKFLKNIPHIPHYKIRNGTVDISDTGLEISNEEVFRVFLFICNLNISLDEIDYFIGQMNLSNLQSLVDIQCLETVFGEISENGDIKNCKEEFLELGLSTEMLNYDVEGAISFLLSFLMFKYMTNILINNANNREISTANFRTGFNDIYGHTIEFYIDELENYVNGLKKCNKEIDEMIKARDKFVKMLESGELEEVVEVESDFYNLGELYLEYLKIVNENIKREYAKSIKEMDTLCLDYEKTYIRRYLLTKGINFTTIDTSLIEEIEKLDEVFVKKLINLFEICNVSCYEMFYEYYSLFKKLNRGHLDILKELITRKILTVKTLTKHLLDIDKKVLLIVNNKEILENYIEFKNDFYNDEILFQDSHELRDNILILSLYDINKDIFTYLLANMDKVSILDKMIEKRIPLYFFMNIVNSYNPELVVDKIIIADEIGLKYYNEEMMLEKNIAVANRFLVPDEMVKDYIVNDNRLINNISIKAENVNWDLINKMDSLYIQGNNYVINNIIISRAKFIRNIANGDDIITALIRGSVLSSEEILLVEDSINNKEKLISKK